MLVYAHRAGRGLAPENTLYACQTALQFPIDFIDFDVGMTKDGMLVVTHDTALNPDITRDACGEFISQPIPIYELTYQQLAIYNVGQINPRTEYASYFPHQRQSSHAQIPLLKEAIDYVQSIAGERIGFQIEIKTNPAYAHMTAPPEVYAETLYQILQEASIFERTEIQSFDFRPLLNLQKMDSKTKTTYLTKPADDLAFSNLWTAGYAISNFSNSFPKMIKALGGSCWGPFQMDVQKANIIEAQEIGLKVVPWGYPEKEPTEFNHPQIIKLIEWGVDGIITDRPDTLIKVLTENL